MSFKNDRIFNQVMLERTLQDEKWGTIQEHPHTLFEWVGIMEQEISEAKEAWFQRPCENAVKAEIIQVIAVGFAALEQHGLPQEED